MTPGERLALPYLFEFWAHPHQLPPEGDWRTWVILGGRGAGKTRAGSEWVRAQVEGPKPLDRGRCRRIALIGETYDQAREVMIQGDSGIMACTPPDRKPRFIQSRRTLIWPNGAEATIFSAQDPEALRGPQFDGAWADELAKWKKARDVWDMLQFGLRLGSSPRVCVTTTPRNVDVLKELLELSSTVSTHAKTEANRAHLAASFLEEVRARYAGQSLGLQELDGILLDQVDGALWTREILDGARAGRQPDLDRIVVAVDPPAGSGPRADACGIVVAGIVEAEDPRDRRAYVLEDASVQGLSPTGWAEAAIDAARRWEADRIVGEVNQGGDMVETTLRQIDPYVAFKAVHATRGKSVRAEPVAALYEQGRVKHARGLDEVEAQMCLMTSQGFEGAGSPDRVDALVWALTELMLDRPAVRRVPQVRVL
ncbi:DNA-packaging protein [Mameliella sediminis]|uniref:DNA-packaging protein n=1 Tax=Mameliella sediminis TaxID=2836866 RepID=UPI001C439AC5|nr:terminase family protein [Mameliella sediminis]MBV7393585.1 terminase family protein [Mameliella sediminis]